MNASDFANDAAGEYPQPDNSARQQARIAVAREEGYTDIVWTINHELGWRWDWAGRPPRLTSSTSPNPPVVLPHLWLTKI